MRDFVGKQVENHDSATLWDWYAPAVQDFRESALGDWPKSLCHPSGGGIAPLVQRDLFGVRCVRPRVVAFDDVASCAGELVPTVMTPAGDIHIERGARGRVARRVPPGVRVCGDRSAGRQPSVVSRRTICARPPPAASPMRTPTASATSR
jgi:hypothetical protein